MHKTLRIDPCTGGWCVGQSFAAADLAEMIDVTLPKRGKHWPYFTRRQQDPCRNV
jgi:hypothetical protein